MTAISENGTDRAPDGWEIVELGQIADLLNGYAFKSEDYAQSGILNFRVVNIRDQGLIDATNDIEFLPLEFTHSHKQYLLSEGDILVVMVGATRGKMGYIPAGILPALMNQNMWRIVPKIRDDVDRRYLYYFLTLVVPKFVHEYSESARGFFKKSDFRSIKVPKPKFKEQQSIAGVVDVAQRAIEQQERLIALTAELKKALLHKLFSEGLRGEPQKQTEIGPVPESWEVVTLASLFEIKHGYAFEGEFFVAQGRYVLLTPGHFFEEGEFRDQNDKTKYYVGEIPRSYLLAKGDLLVAMTEQKAGLLGSAIIVPESEKFLHNQRLGLIQNLDEQRLDKLFLFYFFNTATVRKQIFLTSSGSKVRHTSPGKIRELSIALPSLDEQGDIVQLLRAVDAKLEVTQRKRQTMTDLFHTLLHQLMTAQIRVNDLDLPAAE